MPRTRKSSLALLHSILFAAVASFPLTGLANDMVIRDNLVNVGDTLETLVKLAGRPISVEHDYGCISSRCELKGFLEKWIYVQGEIQYRVGVFNDRVTSIEHIQAH